MNFISQWLLAIFPIPMEYILMNRS